jgi:AcrR family transcriptional regulator
MTLDRDSAATGRRLDVRERMRNRVRLQQRQKQDSRQRFVAAMREALEAMPYASIAVEDIAARAELSRVTFYKHFASKFEIGRLLHDEFKPRIFEVYRTFAESPSPTFDHIAACIDRLLDFYAREKQLIIAFGQMMVVEPEFVPVVDQQARDIMEYWGRSIPALAVMLDDGHRGEIARIDGRLMLSQLNDFCYGMVVYRWTIDRADGLRIMARNVSRFISDQAELSQTV